MTRPTALADGVSRPLTDDELIALGWTAIDDEWTPPPVVEAEVFADLPRWKFRPVAKLAGIDALVDQLTSQIEQTDPLRAEVIRTRYYETEVYRRSDPLFDQLAGQVNLTSGQVDALWRQADAVDPGEAVGAPG
ncbi:MAG: hypothetical protein WBA67_09170 [Jannaschia sp.]